MGVSPRECPRAGMQLPWDGSCCKIIRVRGLIPNQMLLPTCCATAVLQMKWQSPEPWWCPKQHLCSCAGMRLSSAVVILEALDFFSPELLKSTGQTRKLPPDRKLSSYTVLTNLQRLQTTKAWGALSSPLCFSCVGISGASHKETRCLQTTPDIYIYFQLRQCNLWLMWWFNKTESERSEVIYVFQQDPHSLFQLYSPSLSPWAESMGTEMTQCCELCSALPLADTIWACYKGVFP